MKGKAIIKSVLVKHAVSAEQFFGMGHPRKVVKARADAIQQMGELGMSTCAIARVMNRDHSMVSYWLRPEWRVRRQRYYDEYWQRNNRGKRPRRDKVPPDQRELMLALFAAGRFDEVLRLQEQHGVSVKYARELTAYRRRMAARAAGGSDLPLAAPIRAMRPLMPVLNLEEARSAA